MATTTLDDSAPAHQAAVEPAPARRRWQYALYAIPVAVLELGAWTHRWVTEDAFIYFRVVDNVFAGNGPVFNGSERVEAATGTLWTALLVAGRLLFGWLLPIEWIAVVFGLVLTGLAVLAAQTGAAHLHRPRGQRGLFWPAGIVVAVLLPPMWWFATSGLESSLELAWIAGGFWALARRLRTTEKPMPQSPWWLSVLIGLGPLVRPNLAIFTVVYFAALWWTSGGRWRDRGVSLLWATAVPAAWQIFRMGFYGAIVPNTAIAKSAGSANWSQGWGYLVDFVEPYWLAVPLVLLSILAALVPAGRTEGRRSRIVVTLAPVAGALLSFVYVLRLGGDFMHARFLLPAVFAAVLPISVVPISVLPIVDGRAWRGALSIVCLVALLGWGSAASRASLPYAREISLRGIADERGFWQRAAGDDTPVTLADFAGSFLVTDARKHLAEARAIGPDAVVYDLGGEQGSAQSPAGRGTFLAYRNIGVYGVAAGREVTVVDPHGLSDPLAARLELTSSRERPGHEKNLPSVWILARYAAPKEDDSRALRSARRALGCGELADVLAAANDRLSPGRFLRNLGGAVRRTRVVLPADPAAAEARFCDTQS